MREPQETQLSDLTWSGGSLLVRNSAWNLIGWGLPFLVAVITMPALIKGLGTERFGLLTLIWTAFGYFSLLGLGLGQALTKATAEKLGKGRDEDVPGQVWAALALMAILGVLGAALMGVLSYWLVHHGLQISTPLQHEALPTFYLLAGSLPIVITMTGLGAVLEAHQRFDLINVVRIGLGTFTFSSPFIVSLVTTNLAVIMTVLVAGRFVAWLLYLKLCFRVLPSLRR